ncbi:hypothetical protein, partial [Deinococcus arcticus]|uniref:hypothetical protein n=1 Tax=Deinococcus arcticus TaxID=2136176 RepID=UPI001E38FD25
TVSPVRTVNDELARPRLWEQRQDDTSYIGGTQWMAIKKTIYAANHRVGLRASREARRECSVPNIFGLKQREHHQRQQLHLVLAELGEVRGEAAGQFGQDIGRRTLFSRVTRGFSTPRETVGY